MSAWASARLVAKTSQHSLQLARERIIKAPNILFERKRSLRGFLAAGTSANNCIVINIVIPGPSSPRVAAASRFANITASKISSSDGNRLVNRIERGFEAHSVWGLKCTGIIRMDTEGCCVDEGQWDRINLANIFATAGYKYYIATPLDGDQLSYYSYVSWTSVLWLVINKNLWFGVVTWTWRR
jgi:hypothetical protein